MNAVSIQQIERPKKRKAKEVFQLGEKIVFKVTGIEEYGVFGVKVFEGEEFTGLIHKSIINENPFVQIKRHFKIGDMVTGVIKKFDAKGNMSISTREYAELLPDYFATTKEPKNDVQNNAEEIQIINAIKTEEISVPDDVHAIYEQIKPTLETTLKLISPQAELLFKDLIREVGVVKFCMSLGKIAPQFYVDPGKMLAKAITNDIKESL